MRTAPNERAPDQVPARLGRDDRRATLAGDLLQLMRRHGQPIGAYELVALLKAARGKRPNIYKSLNVLAARGLIVRIASLRRYWALPEALPTPPILLACRQCGAIEIAACDDVRRGLAAMSVEHGFEAAAIEVPGRCRRCREAEAVQSQNEGSARGPKPSFAPSSTSAGAA